MVKNQQNKGDKNPVCLQDLPIEIPEESTQSLVNESLITLGTSSTKNDVNGDGSGLLTVPIKYPSEAKESTRSSKAENWVKQQAMNRRQHQSPVRQGARAIAMDLSC